MAFGLFKKKDFADLILYNAHVYTMDPELPWASAVAIKGEEFLSVGNFEDMDSLMGPETVTRDLNGKYVYPGFIDVHRSPVMDVFRDKYLDLSPFDTVEEIREAVSEWAEDHSETEVIFGYGYKEGLRPLEGPASSGDSEEEPDAEIKADTSFDDIELQTEEGVPVTEAAKILNEAVSDRPVVLLCENNLGCWTNTATDAIVLSTAEEECVRTVTTPYILNLLLPFDFEEIEEDVKRKGSELADQGFTAFLNLQTPDYFEDIYIDALIGLNTDGLLKQRFFGSYFGNRPLIPRGLVHRLMQRKTNCLELGDLIHAETFNLVVDNDSLENGFTLEMLKSILEEVCDKGFSVFFEAVSHDDLLLAYQAADYVRGKGYKNNFVIASDAQLTDEEISGLMSYDSVTETWGTDIEAPGSIYGDVHGMEARIEQLTMVSAEILGMQNKLGSIERGKWADLTIYDTDLFNLGQMKYSQLHCDMTVVAGEIVYDAEEEADEELFQMILHDHF